MHKTPALSENETVIEFFSSYAVRAAKRKKAIRRRIIIAVLAAAKILTVAYFGFGDLIESRQATAADVHVGHSTAAGFTP